VAKYMIESPHTKAECLKALDDTLAKGPEVLARFEFGCMAGNHCAWAIVEADSEASAKALVPNEIVSKARVVRVDEITPDQIRSFHQR
jgi:hypothetical protein